MKNIRFSHHDTLSGAGKNDESRKEDVVPSIRVLQTWDKHREYLLRNKLRLF